MVDYVNPDKVVTDVALLKEFDLRLHTTEDLVLDAEFKLCMSSRKILAVRDLLNLFLSLIDLRTKIETFF